MEELGAAHSSKGFKFTTHSPEEQAPATPQNQVLPLSSITV